MTLDDAMHEADLELVREACVAAVPALRLTEHEAGQILELHEAAVVLDGARTLRRLRAAGLGERAYVEVLAESIRTIRPDALN